MDEKKMILLNDWTKITIYTDPSQYSVSMNWFKNVNKLNLHKKELIAILSKFNLLSAF